MADVLAQRPSSEPDFTCGRSDQSQILHAHFAQPDFTCMQNLALMKAFWAKTSIIYINKYHLWRITQKRRIVGMLAWTTDKEITCHENVFFYSTIWNAKRGCQHTVNIFLEMHFKTSFDHSI